jgi:hypothetical protein
LRDRRTVSKRRHNVEEPGNSQKHFHLDLTLTFNHDSKAQQSFAGCSNDLRNKKYLACDRAKRLDI